MIDFPEHYRGKSGKQLIQLIEGLKMGFTLGSALKNIIRAAHWEDSDVQKDIAQAMFLVQYYRENPEIHTTNSQAYTSSLEDWVEDFGLKRKWLANGERNHKRALGSAFRFIIQAAHCDRNSLMTDLFLGDNGAIGDLERYLRTVERLKKAEL